MDSTMSGRLAGWETHGFHTMEDLDMNMIAEEAHSRWLRPNEIYAILYNYKSFNVRAKPVDTPTSGTLILFDRKALRNFRKDGHSWQKKKDGKTVKEAHEHLKVGNEERIHVYYAHGEDNPKFVRRSYWLLDRAYEHIVLVHYREVSEVNTKSSISPQGGRNTMGTSHLSNRICKPTMLPMTPANSSSSSGYSEKPASWISSEELDSGDDASVYTHLMQASGFKTPSSDGVPPLDNVNKAGNLDPGNAGMRIPEDLTIHQINTLDWEDLVEPQGCLEGIYYQNRTQPNKKPLPSGQFKTGDMLNTTVNGIGANLSIDYLQHQGKVQQQNISCKTVYGEEQFPNVAQTGNIPVVEHQQFQAWKSDFKEQNQMGFLEQDEMLHNQWVEGQNQKGALSETVDSALYPDQSVMEPPEVCEPINTGKENSFKKQDSFGLWLSSVLEVSPNSADEWQTEDSRAVGEVLDSHVTVDQSPVQGRIFCITEISPMWAFSSEETKVIITGYFIEAQSNFLESKWSCVFGEEIVAAEIVQPGVFRCKAPPQASGMVSVFLTCSGRVPHSQILSFEYRSMGTYLDNKILFHQSDKSVCEEFALQIRLVHLLFSSFKGTLSLSSKITERAITMERIISLLFTNNEGDWFSLPKAVVERRKSIEEAKSHLLQLILKKKLQEWLVEKVVERSGSTVRDRFGQGVIHLIAALGYEWAIIPITAVGMSIDFRDRSGWTALHWAAFYGRERMVAALLAAGANASLVTDPKPESPGGWTPADLAFKKGYEGLAGYLAEKALTTHLSKLTLYNNNDPRKMIKINEFEIFENLSEDELCMRDSLAAVRIATEAAAKIQAAFREHSFKLRVKSFESAANSLTKEETIEMISALRIQRAFREHREKKQIAAVRRIQHKFRGWKARKEFLNLRQQVIKIQAYYRGHRIRKQYRKILWSVGILEKAILRWRHKGKGLRGVGADNEISYENAELEPEPESDGEEDFFKIGRKYAEERVERSITRVQAMYGSYQARAEYRRMKQCHNQAQLEYEQINDLNLNEEPMTDASTEQL